MYKLHASKFILPFICLFVSSSLLADETKSWFSIDAEFGYLSDSNVGIADLDTNTGTGDTAARYELGLKATLPVSGRLTTRFGYDYSVTAYQELSQFDLGLHHVFADLTWKSSFLDAGIGAEKFNAALDGDDYLDVTQVSPSVSRLIGGVVFLRGAYISADKKYASLPERDAVNSAYRGDMYMLIDNMDRYISFGIQAGEENAESDAFDYDSLRWNMSYGHRVGSAARPIKLKAQMSIESRSYISVDDSIDSERQDKRLRLRFGADWTIYEYLGLTVYAEHTNIRSNLDSAALSKTIYGIALNTGF